MLKNSHEAREYFKEKGFTYSILTDSNITLLANILRSELKEHNKLNSPALYSMKLVNDIYTEGVEKCFFNIEILEIGIREAISFNGSGFIGFAGWGSTANCKPFLGAFKKWCDNLIKNGKVK